MRGRGDQRFVDADGDGVCDRFVDADGDGINDNSPLAGLDLTDDQKAAIAEIRASGTGPHRDAVLEILTEEQVAQLEECCADGQCRRMGKRQGRRGSGL